MLQSEAKTNFPALCPSALVNSFQIAMIGAGHCITFFCLKRRWFHRPLEAVVRFLGTPLVWLAMFYIAGGHWAVLQSVAWAGMLYEYAQSDGIARAVEKTFDGRHPCAMCERIATAKHEEQKTPFTVVKLAKFEFIGLPVAATYAPPLSCRFSYPPKPAVAPLDRPEAPPVPVPICA